MIGLRLLQHVGRRRPRILFLDLGLHVCRTLLLLVPPLLVSDILLRYQQQPRLTPTVGWLIAGILVASVVRVAVVLFARTLDGTVRASIVSNLTRSTLRAVLSRPGAAPLRGSVGDVVNRLSVDTTRMSQQSTTTFEVAATGVQAVVAVSVMVRIDLVLTSAVVIPTALAALTVVAIRTRSVRLYAAEREAVGHVSQLIRDAVAGAADIRAAGAQDAVVARLRTACRARRRATVSARTWSEVVVGATMSAIPAFGTGLVLAIGSVRLSPGAVAGELVLFVSYVGAVLSFVGAACGYAASQRLAQVSADRLEATAPGAVAALDQAERALAEADVPSDPFWSLAVEGLTFSHADTGAGIEDVSFSLRRGDLVVVIGPVGSGKTTLVRAVLGLLTPSAGRVLVNGNEQTSLRLPRFGYTAQRPGLVDGTVRTNVVQGAETLTHELPVALWTGVLDEEVASWPDGVETVVGRGGATLSGGQTQRVAAARMRLRVPDVYFVDDPSSSLDSETESKMWQRLLERPGLTCVAVTNQRWLAERADLVVVLAGGQVEAAGPWNVVSRDSPTLRELFADIETDPIAAPGQAVSSQTRAAEA